MVKSTVQSAIAQTSMGLLGMTLTPLAWQFQLALRNPSAAQARVKQQVCDRLRRSAYGQAYGVRSTADWPSIPIVTYDELSDWLTSQQGKLDWTLLTPEPIQFYEKTSGSRGAAKLIPYTKFLHKAFNHMFCLWAQDVLCNGPRFTTGKTYFCVSPQLGKVDPKSPVDMPKTSAEPNTGLATDADYLQPWLKRWLSPYLVMPAGINQIQSAPEFQQRLALTLLTEPNLEIISIWSPSFLTAQFGYIAQHRDQLLDQLGDRLARDRQQLLQQTPIPWAKLWPNLKLISCWDSAYSADSAQVLRTQFSHAWVQGKGLLATEAPMTVPLIAAQGCVPLLTDVLFEFEDDTGHIHELADIKTGETYQLVISPIGGFYRYRIGDRVRVSHWYNQTPCLEFIGRDRSTSDLVGEKLQADFVQTCLARVLSAGQIQNQTFQMLVPTQIPQPHYVLLLDQLTGDRVQLVQNLEQELQRSPQYQQARLLGQLAAVSVHVHPRIVAYLTEYQMQQGKTWGDLKFPLLDPTVYPLQTWPSEPTI